MSKEIVIGNNKFIWDGNELRIFEIAWPSQEKVMTRQELKELIKYNEEIGRGI